MALYGWDYPDHDPSGQRWSLVNRAGYFRPVIDTMDGETVRKFLEQSWAGYFNEETLRKLPVAIGYFVTAETHSLPMELELVAMFILLENLKATFAESMGYPYKGGYYQRPNGKRWNFKDLLQEMFRAVGMSPALDDIKRLRDEIIHSGFSQTLLPYQVEIYGRIQDVCREYFVRLLGYTGPYLNYSDRGVKAVRAE